MIADLQALATAVAGVGGATGQIVYVVAPAQAQAARVRMIGQLPYDVLSSSALAAGTIMAIALPALVSVVDSQPHFAFANSATVHMEDTTPLDIATGAQGSAVLATPTKTMFQTNSTALRLVFRVTWGLRASNAVAWTSATTW